MESVENLNLPEAAVSRQTPEVQNLVCNDSWVDSEKSWSALHGELYKVKPSSTVRDVGVDINHRHCI